MNASNNLRDEVNKYLDVADDRILKMVHAMLEADMKNDFWDDLPSTVQEEIDIALKQSEEGKGRKHEEVIRKYQK